MQNIHAHFWDYEKHYGESVKKESVKSRGFELNLNVNLEKIIEDSKPFDKVVIFGLKAKKLDEWVPDQYIADIIKIAPDKFYGFACCDPTQPNYMEELFYAFQNLHLSGLKMLPVYAGFDPRDPRCNPVYQYCQNNSIPILFHSGTTYNHEAVLGYSRPWLFDDIAIRYPDLKIVLAHMGHPWTEECIAVIRKHKNMFADISALYYRPWQFYNTMIAIQEYNVKDKILFGTDYPFASGNESILGVKNVNKIIGESGLPKVSENFINEVLERDSFSLLNIRK